MTSETPPLPLTQDMNSSRGTSADDTTVGRLKGLALKGAEAHEVPLISVASAVVEHWEVLQEPGPGPVRPIGLQLGN